MNRVSRILAAATAGLALSLVGCQPQGDADLGSQKSAVPDPIEVDLRLNHIQAKGTHNSYHIDSWFPVPEWQYTHEELPVQASEQGVRKFELDLHYNPVRRQIDVFHAVVIDRQTQCKSLTECLTDMKEWSDSNPGHHPIFFLLEPKENPPRTDQGEFMALLEETIADVWPMDRIVTPDLVRGSHATLPDALADVGWPSLDAVRGRAFFVLHDTGELRDIYTADAPVLEGKRMFVESSASDDFGAFLIMNDPIGSIDAILNAVSQGFIVRTRSDSSLEWNAEKYQAALASGAHIISTDFPAPREEGGPYLDIPGGNPSRCNPIVAPAGCTSAMIENLD